MVFAICSVFIQVLLRYLVQWVQDEQIDSSKKNPTPLATAITGNGSAYSYKNKYENKYCAGNIWQNQGTENSSSRIAARCCFERVIWLQNACWKMIVWFLLLVSLWHRIEVTWLYTFSPTVEGFHSNTSAVWTAFRWQRLGCILADSEEEALMRICHDSVIILKKFGPVDKHTLFWTDYFSPTSQCLYFNTLIFTWILAFTKEFVTSLYSWGPFFFADMLTQTFLLSLCTQSTNKCTTLAFLSSAECSFRATLYMCNYIESMRVHPFVAVWSFTRHAWQSKAIEHWRQLSFSLLVEPKCQQQRLRPRAMK